MESGLDILIADSHPISRLGASSYLTSIGHRIVFEASSWEETLLGSLTTNPNIVLMEYLLPNLSNGFMDKSLSKLASNKNILFYSDSENVGSAVRVIENGAKGYILKSEPIDSLSEAVLSVSRGEAYFSPMIAQAILTQRIVKNARWQNSISNLTPREREVLIEITEGFSNKEIAGRLDIGVRTVETHRERIMKKLDIHSIAGLTKFAVKQGYVNLDYLKKL